MSNVTPGKDDMLTDDQIAVKQTLSQHLDNEVEQIDFTVASKLSAARQRALAEQTTSTTWYGRLGWQHMATALASLALVYVLASQIPGSNAPPPTAQDTEFATVNLMEELSLLAEGEDIEFYQNLEFLEWLENNS